MYKLVIKVHKLFFSSHVIKVHLRTSGGGRGGGGDRESGRANPRKCVHGRKLTTGLIMQQTKTRDVKNSVLFTVAKGGTTLASKKILDKTQTTNSPNSAVRPVPYACAQPYHPQC